VTSTEVTESLVTDEQPTAVPCNDTAAKQQTVNTLIKDKVSVFSPGAINGPIPLIAYTGTLYIAITGGYLVLLNRNEISLSSWVYTIPVVFPILLLVSIVYLITRHHAKLYSPSEFSSTEYFLKTITSKSDEIVDNHLIEQLHITDSKNFDPKQIRTRRYRDVFAKVSGKLRAFEAVIKSLSPSHLETMHSWYNAMERHDLALICMDLAIAQGAIGSRNFSYRSASLRKLHRLVEAKASANLSISLDPLGEHSDAHYNLAKIEYELGNHERAVENYLRVCPARVNPDKLETLKKALFPDSPTGTRFQ
jgi:hypothetical protein